MGRILAFAIVVQLLLALPSYADIIKGPYLQSPGTSSITVIWETTASSSSRVEYGRTSALGSSASGPLGTLHQVTLKSLGENAAYYYKVQSGADVSSVYTFRTASNRATSFRFVAFGDSRSNPSMVATISGQVGSLKPKPAFAVHTGDIVTNGTKYSLWGREFFTPQHPMMASIPVFTALGNHEDNAACYFSFFALPDNERWYSFKYGNAVFICLDTTSSTDPGSEQYAWFSGTLEQYAGKKWKFVYFHHPPFSTGGHGSELTVRKNLQPLFEKYHVDMVFSGHDHDYERSELNGVTYIVTGGYGAPLYGQYGKSEYSRFFSSVNHFCVVDISGSKLTMNVINSSGGTVEEYSINKPPPIRRNRTRGGRHPSRRRLHPDRREPRHIRTSGSSLIDG